jgi:hypothetical protein
MSVRTVGNFKYHIPNIYSTSWMADIILASASEVTMHANLSFIQIYRCYLIWNRQKWVLAIPTLLFLPSIASKFTFNPACLPNIDTVLI